MAFGSMPKKHDVKLVTIEDVKAELAKYPDSQGLKDFIECYKEGDELFIENSNNGHMFYSQYVGRRSNSITYVYRTLFGIS